MCWWQRWGNFLLRCFIRKEAYQVVIDEFLTKFQNKLNFELTKGWNKNKKYNPNSTNTTRSSIPAGITSLGSGIGTTSHGPTRWPYFLHCSCLCKLYIFPGCSAGGVNNTNHYSGLTKYHIICWKTCGLQQIISIFPSTGTVFHRSKKQLSVRITCKSTNYSHLPAEQYSNSFKWHLLQFPHLQIQFCLQC